MFTYMTLHQSHFTEGEGEGGVISMRPLTTQERGCSEKFIWSKVVYELILCHMNLIIFACGGFLRVAYNSLLGMKNGIANLVMS